MFLKVKSIKTGEEKDTKYKIKEGVKDNFNIWTK